MMADPNPSDLPAFDFRQGTIMNPDPYRPDFTLQELKPERGVVLICQPELMTFPCQLLDLHRQRVE
jgi:hypothetical protein